MTRQIWGSPNWTKGHEKFGEGIGKITQFYIEYDNAENWYTGTGTPGPTQVALESIAAHEFGHALGMCHTQASHCPGNSTDATMCSGYLFNTFAKNRLN